MARVHRCSDQSGQHVGWTIHCPACGEAHHLSTKWEFNGDLERPTFTPSLLVQSGHHVTGHSGPCWCDYQREHPGEPSFSCSSCHSHIKDGAIQYLSDCTHAMAGQTVPLPDF